MVLHKPQTSTGGVVAVEPGPTNTKTPTQHNGPVRMLYHKHTFAYSRVQQGAHSAMFLRAWCPGLYGASPAEGNHDAFLSELDGRLRNSHVTLRNVQQHSKAVVQSCAQPQRQQELQSWHSKGAQGHHPLQYQPGYPHAPYEQQQHQLLLHHGNLAAVGNQGGQQFSFGEVDTDLYTAQLRKAVNASLATQLDFFGGCLARWASGTRDQPCRCIGCDCVCAQTDASLRSRVYEGPYSCL
ncbi:hypothetical protein DUNSADRAFT_18647 [Dunaliella salina]|uniref:Encoded protein n=1 Tax=Dunaliella salina TaxID=3046 RepID=A0ABQ7GYT2_DUNSA|nr:hypothetical protein DUNSADRAFT_18647 [Dunaliella salina]|eukprot:KAF5839769.1 hypothetical protein DUNSADRAFT_18647 [Dunaliella salina]